VRNFSGEFEAGTATAFRGPEGCGIGLLMNVLGMIERPDSGDLRVLGQTVLDLESNASRQLRDKSFGFLFTHPHLLPGFTAAENIAMPFLRLCRESSGTAATRVAEVLDFTGLEESIGKSDVANLDSDSLWRVAFARAIVHRPEILVAISPPAPFLISLAARYARENGACVLWNAGSEASPVECDRVIETEFAQRE
jgi:ABC-type lipoprotein export system ATPase subunit